MCAFKSYWGSIPRQATRGGCGVERCTVSEGHAGIFHVLPRPLHPPLKRKRTPA
nr:MAG TPA: hypothetical protein [Caudoviricetes sp.]